MQVLDSASLKTDGFAVVEDVLEPGLVDALTAAVERAAAEIADSGEKPGYAFRDVFKVIPQTLDLVRHPRVCGLVAAALGREAFAVRAILFDKVDGANWHVGWHQDQAIAIRERVDVPGFGPTSMKNGIPHTRASAEVLEHMLAVRLHLDNCGTDNGPLRCVPGSHRRGRLDPAESLTVKQELGEVTCTVGRGGALLMRPLCLHASSPATTPRHRRVIHIEFAACELPKPLKWYERHPIA